MSKPKYYEADYPLYPLTKTDYIKKGKKWEPVNIEKSIISRKQTKFVFDKTGLPFESSHRLEKRDKYLHNEPYDTFSSINPDKTKKTTWYVDFAQGHKNYVKKANKHYYDKRRYEKLKGSF